MFSSSACWYDDPRRLEQPLFEVEMRFLHYMFLGDSHFVETTYDDNRHSIEIECHTLAGRIPSDKALDMLFYHYITQNEKNNVIPC